MCEYLEGELAMCGKSCNVTIHQSEVSFHPTETCQAVAVGLFAGSLGGTSGSVASQPSMMFLWSALDATGLLALSTVNEGRDCRRVSYMSHFLIEHGAIWFHDVTTFDSLG
jgi:hypothetical protein